MVEHIVRRPAGTTALSRLTHYTGKDWSVLAISGAGSFFILLGLIALALPSAYEGILIYRLGPDHALRLMDVAGMFGTGIGVILSWLGGMLWQRQMKS